MKRLILTSIMMLAASMSFAGGHSSLGGRGTGVTLETNIMIGILRGCLEIGFNKYNVPY